MRLKKQGIVFSIIVMIAILVFLVVHFGQNTGISEGNNAVSDTTIITNPEESEYIFPHSNTEFLKEEDLENLSESKLALARNEIYARNGRIFKEHKYKQYFGQKSWYKGTISPEEFDRNFENELNGVEKANIALISEYEEVFAQKKKAHTYYQAILAEYQEAEQNQYAGGAEQYPNVNEMLFTDSSGKLYYTTVDLCDDGVPELFIASQLETDYNILDIYGYADEMAQHLTLALGLSNDELEGYYTMGNRAHYSICQNGMIKEEGSSGAAYNSVTYYQLQDNSVTLKIIDGVTQDNSDFYRTLSGGLEAEQITEEKYLEIMETYPLETNLQWWELAN